jgi:hypothetical protein
MNRREFLGAAAAISLTGRAMFPLATFGHASSTGRNLVPDRPAAAPNYWCTWAVQNYLYGQDNQTIDVAQLEGSSGASLAHNAMNENVLLGAHGWALQFYPRIRKDLYLLLDDGWESGGTSTFQLDPVKFSSFKGSSVERLRALSRRIEGLGWRGLALWCRNTPGGEADINLENLCKDAGVHYWKVDIGDQNFNLIRRRDEAGIPLTLEHVQGEPPLNGDWSIDGKFGSQPWDSERMRILRHTDVYRTYDVTAILSLPTTLDRTSEMLHAAAGHPEIRSLLNVEDEVYVAAVLGCTMGVMRHPLQRLRPAGDPDLFFNGVRNCKSRMDEVVRALRWQRIAQPYPVGTGTFQRSSETLRDGWKFRPGDTWNGDLVGSTVWQSAPSVLARNMELPIVSSDGEKPFVFAARFPNGAVAVGSQERTSPNRAWYMPHSSVAINVSDAPGPFGIFGTYKSLTFEFLHAPHNKRVLAQDLAGSEALDITAMTSQTGNKITIDGELLRRIGGLASTPGDLSSPGAVVAFALP